MWSQAYTTTVPDLNLDKVWKVWADVDHWNTWQKDLEYAKLEGGFNAGEFFLLKPKGGPKVRIEFLKVEPGKGFTDLTRFPGARMFGIHTFTPHAEGLEIRTKMRIQGSLSFVWRKLVAEGIAKGLPVQTEQLVNKVRNG